MLRYEAFAIDGDVAHIRCFFYQAVLTETGELSQVLREAEFAMTPFHPGILEYRKQLRLGKIQEGYRGLMAYFRELRAFVVEKHPDAAVSGIQYGLMDFTYFFYASKLLGSRQLKIAVLFAHESFTFELWLVGSNKGVQGRYQRLFAASGWNKYPVAHTTKGVYHIIRKVLIDNPEFRTPGRLTKRIESGMVKFARELEKVLRKL